MSASVVDQLQAASAELHTVQLALLEDSGSKDPELHARSSQLQRELSDLRKVVKAQDGVRGKIAAKRLQRRTALVPGNNQNGGSLQSPLSPTYSSGSPSHRSTLSSPAGTTSKRRLSHRLKSDDLAACDDSSSQGRAQLQTATQHGARFQGSASGDEGLKMEIVTLNGELFTLQQKMLTASRKDSIALEAKVTAMLAKISAARSRLRDSSATPHSKLSQSPEAIKMQYHKTPSANITIPPKQAFIFLFPDGQEVSCRTHACCLFAGSLGHMLCMCLQVHHEFQGNVQLNDAVEFVCQQIGKLASSFDFVFNGDHLDLSQTVRPLSHEQ